MKTIELTIDDRQVVVEEGTSVFDAARMNGISIPVLCHAQNERPVGVCRVCTVDCGDKVLQASCVRPAENGMKVYTASDKVKKHRRMILELLMSDHPEPLRAPAGQRRLRTGDAGGRGRRRAPRASASAFRPRGQDDSSLGHLGRSRSLHPLRPLHPRLRRDPAEQRAGAPRQGLQRRHRVRSEPAHGQFELRLLRRVHGVLPHRRAHQQERGRAPCCRAAIRSKSKSSSSCRSSRRFPERSSN